MVDEPQTGDQRIPEEPAMSNIKDVRTDGDSNTIKDPDDWTTGDEPMTGAQRSYLKTLADEAGEQADDDLTKAEASKRIEDLRAKTGRDESGGR